jgi:hypothetical protein
MESIDEVLGHVSAVVEAVNEIQARVEATKADAEVTEAQLRGLGVEAGANAVGAGKEQLAESVTAMASLANKLQEARELTDATKYE